MLTLVGIEEKEVAMMEESTSKPSKMHLRVIEFFSGIGGMHYALKNLVREREDITHEVVAAYDFSTTANDVYRHNHTGSTVSSFLCNDHSHKVRPNMYPVDPAIITAPFATAYSKPYTKIS